MRYVRTVTLGIDPDASSHLDIEARARRLFLCAAERIEAAGRQLRTRRLLLPALNARPRFSRTKPEGARPPAHAGQHSVEVLEGWGFSEAEIRALRESKAIA